MKIEQSLTGFFGYKSFRSGQKEIIEAILNGKEVLAILPTGAGKSICYQIPALISERFSIVVSPLISLMKDQVDSLNQKKIVAAFINSTLDRLESEKVLNGLAEDKIKLLYAAPEKLQNIEFAERIKNLKPNFLFVDEAHCISEWGHNFRPSYRKIKEFADNSGIERIAAFTATATPEVKEDIIKQLGFTNPKIFISGFERENIFVSAIRTKQKKEKTLQILKENPTPAIVYCATRRAAEEASNYLQMNKYNSVYYHAGLSPEIRRVIQDDFQNGRSDIICATNAFGMGIDKSDIRTIIHYNMPGSIESYYQEIGRAGRDGLDSRSFLLYDNRDRHLQNFLIKSSLPSKTQALQVYDLVCDFSDTALGQSNTNEIALDENFRFMIQRHKISDQILTSAAQLLEQAGYLKVYPPALNKLKFALSIGEVKKYVLKIAKYELRDLIMLLIKYYGSSIFENKITINTEKIGRALGISSEKVTDNLLRLTEIGILQYTAKRPLAVIRLMGTRIPAKNLDIDFNHLKMKEKSSLQKLEKISELVSTRECRFGQILSYFGEIDRDFKCGHCDNCKGLSAGAAASNEYIEEKILTTILKSKGSLKKKYLIRILLGNSQRPAMRNYETFESCRVYKKNEIIDSIASLLSKNMISDFNEILTLTEKGQLYFAPFEEKSSEPMDETDSVTDTLAVFNKLRILRKETAVKFSQSLGIICSDEILRRIAEKKPVTISKFISIPGVNQRMFNKFGLEAIEVIKEHLKSKTADKLKTNIPGHLLDTLSLVKKGYSLFELKNLKKLPEAVLSFEIESLLEFYPDLSIDKLMPQKEIKEIKRFVQEDFIDLKEIKEKLPHNISYAKIRIVAAKYKNKKKS